MIKNYLNFITVVKILMQPFLMLSFYFLIKSNVQDQYKFFESFIIFIHYCNLAKEQMTFLFFFIIYIKHNYFYFTLRKIILINIFKTF